MEEKYIVVKYEWMDDLLKIDSIDQETKHAIVYQIVNYIAYGELLIKGNPIIDAFTVNIIREINEEKESDDINSYGVYGMYRNDELIYVGMTMRSFRQRWKEHQGYIKNKSNALSVYSLIEDDDKIEFKILFDVMKNGMPLSEKEVKAIERKFIVQYSPIGNVEGNLNVNLGGRPSKIDYNKLKELKNKGWKNKDIAYEFNCSESTIEKSWRKIRLGEVEVGE